jgi:integrase
MSVKADRKRGTWYFVVDVPTTNGARRQIKRRGFLTRKAAVAAERTLLDQWGAGTQAPARLTFGGYLTDRWLPAIDVDPRLKPTTRAAYRSAARHLVTHVGGVPLVELTAEHLDAVQRALAHRSASLRHQVHVCASKSLRQAVRWKLIATSPAVDATPPPQPTSKPVSWTPLQVARFLEHARADRWWPLWRFLAVTGARRSEAVALTWSQLDLERGEVTLDRAVVVADGKVHDSTTKSGRARIVTLDPETVAVLRAWRAQQAAELLALGAYRPAGGPVFTWPDATQVHPNVVTRTFARIVAQAGNPPLRLHGLRHSFANAALDAGVELVDVSKRLGHSSIRVTADIYTPASTPRDRAAVNAVAGLYSSAASTS